MGDVPSILVDGFDGIDGIDGPVLLGVSGSGMVAGVMKAEESVPRQNLIHL